MLEAGKLNGIQQIWDICHFGFPDDLSPLHPQFTKRFVGVCSAFRPFLQGTLSLRHTDRYTSK